MKKNKEKPHISIKTAHFFNKKDLLCTGVLLLLILIFFFNPLFTGKTYFINDIEALGYPIHHYKYEMGQRGKLFLWDPYTCCGQPYFSDVHNALFYPVTWIYFFIKTETALAYYVVIHFLFTGIFSYIYLRSMNIEEIASLGGAIFYTFSGFMVVRIVHINFVTAYALLPVSLYFTNKLLRDKNLFFSLLLGLSLSLSFLSGNYQISMMVYVIVFIYFIGHLEIKNIFKKDQLILTGFFLIAIIFSTLLISVQLIPTMEYLSQTLRTVKGVDYKEATKDSLGLKEIIMLFIPDYYGLPWQNPHYTGKIYHWEACYYIGIFPFLLTLIGFILRGKEKRNLYIWAIIILLGFIMALGKHMPLYKFLFNYVPLFKSYRVPIRFLFFIFPGLLYYTGFSLNQLLNLPKPVNWKNYKNILITLIFCGIFILFLSFFSFIHGNISFFFIFTGLGGILTIYLKLSGKIKRNVFAVITITLLITSAFSFGLIYNPTRDQAYFKERSSIFTPLENKIPPARMYYLIPPELLGHLHGTRNMASTKRICSLLGYNPLILQRYASYLLYASSGKMLSSLDPESLGKFDLIHLDNLDSSMMKLLNLKYVYIFMQREKYENNIIDLKNPYERAFIVRDYKVIKEDNKILEMLKSKEFNPEKILILKEDPGVKTKNQELVEEKVSITEFEPDYIRIEINPEVKEPSLLFLSEIYYPGWKAKVHGEERKVYRANYLFRAISLKQGDKIVEFYFSPDSFKIGVLITITSLLFLLIVIIKTFLSTYRKKKE